MANVFDVAYLLPNKYTVLCRKGANLGESWLMTRRQFKKEYPGGHWMSPRDIGKLKKEEKLYLYGNRTVRNFKGNYIGQMVCKDQDNICIYDGNNTYLYCCKEGKWVKEETPMSALDIMGVYSNINSHFFQCTEPAFACEARYDEATTSRKAKCNNIVYKHILELYGKETIMDLAKVLEFGQYTNDLGIELQEESNGYTYCSGHNFNDKVHGRIHELISQKDDWTPILELKRQAIKEFDAEEINNVFIPRGYIGPLESIDGEYVGEVITEETPIKRRRVAKKAKPIAE